MSEFTVDAMRRVPCAVPDDRRQVSSLHLPGSCSGPVAWGHALGQLTGDFFADLASA